MPRQSSVRPSRRSSSSFTDDSTDQSLLDYEAAVWEKFPVNKFLDVKALMSVLNVRNPNLPKEVPAGRKENVYVVVDNELNVQRRAEGLTSRFHDDRGAWSAGPSSKTLFHRQTQGLKTVVLKDGVFCREQKRQKTRSFIPLDPQPDPAEIIELHRFYTKHTSSPTYEKRVSWVEYSGAPTTACHEYKGTCPEPKPHGRTTTGRPGNYVRLNPKKNGQNERIFEEEEAF